MKDEKFLLITTDESLPILIDDVFTELNKKFDIITVSSISDGIDKIISNGFTFTIIDMRSLAMSNDLLSEVAKLNYFARKKLIVISNKNILKKLESFFSKPLNDCMVANAFGEQVKEQIQYSYVNGFFDKELPTQREITKDIVDEIKKIKSSKLLKLFAPLTFMF